MSRKNFLVALVTLLTLMVSLPLSAQLPLGGRFLPIDLEDESYNLQGFVHGGSAGDGLSGIGWLDYNNDGWLDIYVANGIGHNDGLLHNNGDGTFTNVSDAAGIGDANGSTGVAAADMDNDGDVDVVVAGDAAAFGSTVTAASPRPLRVFSNNGNGTFTDVTPGAGFVFAATFGAAMHPTLGDINNDGFLDIFVTAPASNTFPAVEEPNHLFLNNGDMTFTDISAASGVGYSNASCEAAFSHYDDDGYIDLFIADCNLTTLPPPGFPIPFIPRATPLRLFKNNGDLTFSELQVGLPVPAPPEQQPFPATERGYWMCVGFSDIDLDGDLDLFSSNLGLLAGPLFPQPHGMFRNDDGIFTSVEDELGITSAAPEFGWGCSFPDLNNDGWEDLVMAGNFLASGCFDNPGYLFVNEANTKSFRSEPLPVNLTRKYSAGVASGDYNNDGFVDVVISNGSFFNGAFADLNAKPTLLKNMGNENHWITIRLEGRPPSNRSAVGAIVTVDVANRSLVKEVRSGTSFGSQDSLWLTYGLNRQPRARKIEVRWPSGQVETFQNVRGRRTITIVEGEGIQ